MTEAGRQSVVMTVGTVLFMGLALLVGGLAGSLFSPSYGPEDELDTKNPARLWAVEVAGACAPARGLITEKLSDGRMTVFELDQIRDLARAYEGPDCILPSHQAPDTIIVPYVPT